MIKFATIWGSIIKQSSKQTEAAKPIIIFLNKSGDTNYWIISIGFNVILSLPSGSGHNGSLLGSARPIPWGLFSWMVLVTIYNEHNISPIETYFSSGIFRTRIGIQNLVLSDSSNWISSAILLPFCFSWSFKYSSKYYLWRIVYLLVRTISSTMHDISSIASPISSSLDIISLSQH